MQLRTKIVVVAVVVSATGTVEGAPRFEKKTKVVIEPAGSGNTEIAKNGRKVDTPEIRGVGQLRERTAARVALLDDEAIKTLERLIARTQPDEPDRADLLFRLAEHFREKKTYFMLRARELDERIHLAPTSARPTLQASQRSFEAEEQRWLRRTVEAYLAITSRLEYQSYKRLDEVLFGLADLLVELGRHDKARVFFGQLIRNHPQSRFVPDAYLSFAEHYFGQGKVEEALRLYEQVGKYPSSPLHAYALYKQGWCWVNLKDPRRALELFVQVIRESKASRAAGRILLLRGARKDAVRAYSHVGSVDRALPFFRRIAPAHATAMLEILARTYLDQGKFPAAIQTYRRLAAIEPTSQSACSWQHAIVKATIAAAKKPAQIVEAERLAEMMAEAERRGSWTQRVRAECRRSAAGVLRELATTWHREAQVTKDVATYAAAVGLYQSYLRHFAREKDASKLGYYLAEALYSLERWPAAAEAYTRVVEHDPRGPHLRDAAYAAVICWKNALSFQEIPTARRGTHEELLEPIPLSPNDRKMLGAFRNYRRAVPDGDERVTIVYREGRLFYEHNLYADAVPLFAEIATRHPEHELAVYAANLLLDSLNILGRHKELERSIDRFLKEPKLARGGFHEQAGKLKCQLRRMDLERLHEAGRYRECGEGFAELSNSCPNDPRWAELLHNAALCFEAGKMIGMTIKVRDALIKAKPDDPLAQRALYQIGQNYHALAWYSRAADYYERFARAYPGERDAPAALQNAIVFRLGRGELERAREDVKLFERSYAGQPALADRAAAVNFAMGRVYEDPSDTDAALQHYRRYLARYGARGGLDRQIVAQVKLGELLWAQACPQAAQRGPLRGLCARVERAVSRRSIDRSQTRATQERKQCGPETKMHIFVAERNAAKARAARAYFERALALGRGWRGLRSTAGEERDRRQLELESAIASALFHLAEERFEQFLRVEFPSATRLSGAATLQRAALLHYVSDKSARLEAARELYQQVILRKVAHWAIAASARIGQLYQSFADALYTAPIPAPKIPPALATPAARREYRITFAEAYCDELADRAGPLEKKAVEGLATCLRKSTQLSWYNEWSTLCEAELNQIRADVPLAVEIRAQPGYVSARLSRSKLRRGAISVSEASPVLR